MLDFDLNHLYFLHNSPLNSVFIKQYISASDNYPKKIDVELNYLYFLYV